MSNQNKAMLRSWLNVFVSALIASVLVVFTENSGSIPLEGKTWTAVLISAVVAVLPVIKNYFDTHDPRYGRVAPKDQ